MPRRGCKIAPVETSATEFGQLVSQVRSESGVSTRDLAVRVGYHSAGGGANISKYERGELLPPRPEVILEWMEALGYSSDSDATQRVLRAAAKDHHRAVDTDYGRFII